MPTKALQAIKKPCKKAPKKPIEEPLLEDQPNPDTFDESLPEFSRSERIELAYKAWQESNDMSIRKAARIYGISRSTLHRRTKGALSNKASRQARQRLSVGEEEALQLWLLQLNKWGWPARISQLEAIAIDLLRAKGDIEELGIYWTRSFLLRYPELKKKFVVGLDKERSLAQNPDIITNWFQLFRDIVKEYDINSNDIYNIDEKGILIGVIKKVKVLVSKYKKNHYIT